MMFVRVLHFVKGRSAGPTSYFSYKGTSCASPARHWKLRTYNNYQYTTRREPKHRQNANSNFHVPGNTGPTMHRCNCSHYTVYDRYQLTWGARSRRVGKHSSALNIAQVCCGGCNSVEEEEDACTSCCTGYRLGKWKCKRTDCGVSKYTNAGDGVSTMIVGGIVARQNEFPWQVLVFSESSAGNKACGGTIISDRYILTAAVCVYGRPTRGMKVYAGQHSLSDLQQTIPVRSYDTTNYQESNLANNIAIVKLRSRLIVDDTARPACLPTEGQQFVGRDVIISGWGSTASNVNSYLEDELRYTKVKVAPTSKCEAVYGARPNEICATDGGTDNARSACFGDAGGPMVLKENGRFVVIGLSSFVSSTGCAEGRPFGYADVGAYIPWIKSVTGL